MIRLAHLWAIAELLRRSRLVRIAVAVPGIVSMLIMILAIGYLSTTPSGEQEARQVMGDADWMLENVAHPGQGTQPPGGLAEAAVAAGASEAHAVLVSSDVLVDGLSADHYITERPWYAEAAKAGPFTERLTLVGGRWPTRPAEVVVSERLALLIGNPSTFTVFDQAGRWKIVGVLRDELDYDALDIVASPGTWAGIRNTGLHPTALAALDLYWKGDDPDAVAAAITAKALAEGASPSEGAPLSRVLFEQDPQHVFYEPSLQWTVPMVTAVAAAVIVPGLLVLAWVSKVAGALWRIGADERLLRRGGWLALGLLTVPAAILGLAAGLGIGLAARPLWHTLRNAEAPPPFVPWPLAGLVLATVVLALLVVLPDSPARLVKRISIQSFDRQVLILVAVAGLALMIANRASSAEDLGRGTLVVIGAMATVAAVAALVTKPLLPKGDGTRATTLALRLLRRLPGLRLTMAVLIFTIGSGLGVATLFNTAVYNTDAQRVAELPPGSAKIGDGSRVPPPELKAEFERFVGAGSPVALTTLDVRADPMGVTLSATGAAVERLLGVPLTQAQRSTFEGGGILVPEGSSRLLRLDGPAGDSVDLPAEGIALPVELTTGLVGIVSDTTASRHGWDGVRSYLYLGLTESQLELARDFRFAGKYDIVYLHVYTPLPPPAKPYGIFLAAMLLSLGTVVLVLGAASSGAALRMRPMAAGLSAQGIPRRWLRIVLLWQCTWITVISIAFAIAAALLGVGVIVISTPGSLLYPPWEVYGIITVGALAIVPVATALASLRIHQTERLVTV